MKTIAQFVKDRITSLPDLFNRAQNGRPVQLICPCLIGRKDLMTKFYPAAVGDAANAGSDKSSS